jgi:phosphotriesterase-related protein
MAVMTVTGPIAADQLGVTLPHEHHLMDSYKFRPPAAASDRGIAEQPIALRNRGALRRNIGLIRDNLRLIDLDVAVREVQEFKAEGGGTIVDVTPIGLCPDPRGLRRIAHQTGVQIVAGCGYYLANSHPASVAQRSVEELTDELVDVIENGFGETGIRPGIIGEIGLGEPMYVPGHTGDEMHPNEEKVLRAAGRAHCRTGLPVSVHVYNYRPNRLGLLALDVLGEEGVAVERGLLDRLLLSHDVCTKMQLEEYGGWGYAHLSRHIEPRLRRAGLSAADIRAMRVENPARLLDVAGPA